MKMYKMAANDEMGFMFCKWMVVFSTLFCGQDFKARPGYEPVSVCCLFYLFCESDIVWNLM